MRVVDIFTIVLHDFRRSIQTYVICLIIISQIFGVAILVFDFKDVIPDIIRSRFPIESKSATVEFVDAKDDLTKQIVEIGFDKVVLNLAYSYMLRKGLVFQNDFKTLYFNSYEFTDLFNETAISSFCEKVIYNSNEKTKSTKMSAIISESKLMELGISLGSNIVIYDKETSQPLDVFIIGSFTEIKKNDTGTLYYDLLLNNAVGSALLKERGLSTEYVGNAVIKDIFDFPEYKTKLNKLGIRCYGINYGEIVRLNAEITQLMIIIPSILVAIGVFVILMYIIQNITKYKISFGIRLAMGMQLKTIIIEFILIIEFLLFTGLIFSKIIETILYGVVQKKIESVLDIAISIPSVFSLGALFLLVTVNIMLVFAVLLIRKKIMQVNITKIALE
jgi:Fe2+ transport system protein FeoA